MLVLTRLPGQAIRIDGHITVTVLDVKGNSVRLGITAPRQVAVDREEVHERKLLEARTRGRPDGSSL